MKIELTSFQFVVFLAPQYKYQFGSHKIGIRAIVLEHRFQVSIKLEMKSVLVGEQALEVKYGDVSMS